MAVEDSSDWAEMIFIAAPRRSQPRRFRTCCWCCVCSSMSGEFAVRVNTFEMPIRFSISPTGPTIGLACVTTIVAAAAAALPLPRQPQPLKRPRRGWCNIHAYIKGSATCTVAEQARPTALHRRKMQFTECGPALRATTTNTATNGQCDLLKCILRSRRLEHATQEPVAERHRRALLGLYAKTRSPRGNETGAVPSSLLRPLPLAYLLAIVDFISSGCCLRQSTMSWEREDVCSLISPYCPGSVVVRPSS